MQVEAVLGMEHAVARSSVAGLVSPSLLLALPSDLSFSLFSSFSFASRPTSVSYLSLLSYLYVLSSRSVTCPIAVDVSELAARLLLPMQTVGGLDVVPRP